MILCCGEALIDMLPRKTVDGETAFAPYVGGSVFNTAIALGRLDVPAGFCSGLSEDFFGAMLRDGLERSGVGYGLSVISPRPTTLAFVHLDHGQAQYVFFDENSAGRMLDPHALPQIDDTVQALLFGCISLCAEPCGSFYENLMQREAPKRVIFLDPNIRTGFIGERTAHLERMYRMIALADIVKLSDEDLDWFGESGSHADIAAKWLQLGPKLVLITNGARGVEAYTKQLALHLPARDVAVVDTVGAGDTINAALLCSLYRQRVLDKAALAALTKEQLHQAAAFAVDAAAVTVSRAGANPPWAHEMAVANPVCAAETALAGQSAAVYS